MLYPGLGSFTGVFNWSSIGQYDDEMEKAEREVRADLRQVRGEDIPAVAADPQAREMGQRLFLNYCSQCHGSDARGGRGFPNLTDKDWLYGGSPRRSRPPSPTVARA